MGGKKDSLFKNWLLCIGLLCVALILGAAAPGLAEEEEEEEEAFTLEEITVTAEKREAELQKLPMDVAVVRPEEMDRLGVYSVYDVKKLIPDMNTDTMTGNQVMISLRGVGDADLTLWNPIHETTTAVHMDGVQLTRVNAFDNLFFDLQRVEVLKGPQGTLYGRGSTGGSMNMLSQKPILGEMGGYLTLETGNFSLYRAEGAFNIPVSDKLAFRIAARGMKRDGFTDSGEDNKNNRSLRISMTWEPTDKDTITATYDTLGSETQGYGSNGTYEGTYGNAKYYAVTDRLNLGTTSVIALPYQTAWYKQNGVAKWIDNDSWGASLQWERELPFAYAVMLYGHRGMKEDLEWPFSYVWPTYISDADVLASLPDDGVNYLGLLVKEPYSYSHSWSTGDFDSLEARLLSKETITGGDRYEWVVGAVAQDDRVYENNDLGANYWVDIQTKSYGLFGQAAYQIFDNLNFTLGLRHEIDKKDYTGDYGVNPATSYYNPEVYSGSASAEWKETTYKANLSWFITDTIMAYGQYSKGYKTGNITYGGEVHEPEYMDSWEAGIKTRFIDNRLQINATGYFYDYKNYTKWASAYKCVSTIYEDNPAPEGEDPYGSSGLCWDVNGDGEYDVGTDYIYNNSITVTPGGAEQMGGNLNVIYLITSKDTVAFNGSYSKNEYKDFNVGAAILEMYPDADNVLLDASMDVDRTGERFGSAPYRFNMNYNHIMFIGMDTLSTNITAFYNGKGVENTIRGTYNGTAYKYTLPGTPSYWTIDASATYNSSKWVPEGTSWSLRLWCNNLTGRKALASLSYTPILKYFSYLNYYGYSLTPDDGYFSGYYINPRTYGATLTFNF